MRAGERECDDVMQVTVKGLVGFDAEIRRLACSQDHALRSEADRQSLENPAVFQLPQARRSRA